MLEQKEKYRQFREWQQLPHEVAPLSEETHECATCGTHFEGNYCPRCGQSASIGRYSFKKAFLLFLDVWGVGNRGMFRSIRDLILRPGYMIRDYLRGMQMAYFPPFKMFFLLCALSLAVDSGLNIQGVNREQQNERAYAEMFGTGTDTEDKKAVANEKPVAEQSDGKKLTAKEKDEVRREFERLMDQTDAWSKQHITAVNLVLLLLFSLPLWLLFRHSPAIPDLRLSGCFVAMVYIANMITIYGLVPSFLCFSPKAEITYGLLTLLLALIPIRQLSGYSMWSTIWRTLLAFIPFVVVIVILALAFIVVVFVYLLVTK